jgi:hypothetical protein
MSVTIFNHGGGGTSKIRLVQASSLAGLPASADNTVGVVTAATISTVIVSPVQPAAAAGLLWVKTGSPITANRLISLSGTVSLGILGAYYCASSTFARVDCYLRIAGAWVKTNLVLYSGGQSDVTLAAGAYYSGTPLTMNDTGSAYILSAGAINSRQAVYAAAAIDLTDASLISVSLTKTEVAAGYGPHNGIFVLAYPFNQSANEGSPIAVAKVQTGTAAYSTVTTFTVDVSALVGSYYVGYQAYYDTIGDYTCIYDWRVIY